MFANLPMAFNGLMTTLIHDLSGPLQIAVYLSIGLLFFYALGKSSQAVRALSRYDFQQPGIAGQLENGDPGAPLALVAAAAFCKTKKHYLLERRNDPQNSRTIPPDGFIRDAAFQHSERYYEEKFLDPIAMMANLMPPLGFIGTIIGMVVQFLANAGTFSSKVAITGVATALYTTLVGLACYTFLELLLNILTSLARRRIDEGLAAVADRIGLVPEKKAA